MTADKQTEANRANAQNSTGPLTPEGKAKSRMNALSSGIYAKSQIIRGEDPAALEALTAEYHQHHQPDTPAKRAQVDLLVSSEWSLRRYRTAEAHLWDYNMDSAYKLSPTAPLGHAFQGSTISFTRLQRLIDSTVRNLNGALRELERLQAALPPELQPPPPHPEPIQPKQTTPDPPPNGFVPSTSAEPPASRPQPRVPNPDALFTPPGFHVAGSNCSYTPHNLHKFQRCPMCSPEKGPNDAQK